MSFADQLTVARAISVPIVVLLFAIPFDGHDYWATGVFCAAMATDWFDGRVARRTGRSSSFGSLLDPVADKLLLTSAFVTLTYLKVVPFWITAVVVSRDLILSVGVLVIHVAGGTVHPAPTWIGKMSTVFQMGTVVSAMLFAYFMTGQLIPRIFAWLAAAFTIVSGLQYLMQGLKQLNPPASVAGGS